MFNYTQLDADKCEFVPVASVEEVPPGERLYVEIDELSIVIFRIGEQFFAIEDLCSHDDGPVGDGDLDGYQVICPRHGARFDLRTGEARSLPAIVDIPCYPVQVQGGEIEVGIPQEAA